MTYVHADIVWTRQSPSGEKELELLARHDGLFEFRESTATAFDHPMGREVLRVPSYTSGVYATQVEAERDASRTIIWLREAQPLD